MEFLFELFGEFFLSLYAETASCIVPDKKYSKKTTALLKFLSVLASFGALSVLIAGICVIDAGNKTVGVPLTSVGAAVIALHFLLTCFIYSKKKKRKNKNSDKENTLPPDYTDEKTSSENRDNSER